LTRAIFAPQKSSNWNSGTPNSRYAIPQFRDNSGNTIPKFFFFSFSLPRAPHGYGTSWAEILAFFESQLPDPGRRWEP
jgi:hypothetical protein